VLIYRPAHLGKWGRCGYAPAMSWHVYLLTCADGTLYCGVTTDLARRLAEHNAGRAGGGAKYTRARLPVELAASAPRADKSSALRLELAVKKRPRADKVAFLLAQPQAALAAGKASGTVALGGEIPGMMEPGKLEPDKVEPGNTKPTGTTAGDMTTGDTAEQP